MPTQSANFALFFFAYYAHAGTFGTFASLYFAFHGMSAPQIGALLSLGNVMRMFGPNLWGWLADHTQRRAGVLRLTAAGATLSFLGIFFGHSFVQYFVAMVVLNLFTSALPPLSEALMLAEMQGDLSRYGRLRLWGSVGFMLAATGAAYALQWWTIAALPWLAGALLLCVLAASLRIREAPAVTRLQAPPSLRALLRQKAVIAFFCSTALMVAAHTALYVFYSLYLARNGYSKAVIGAMWSLGVLAEIVFFYFQAPVLRRLGAPTLMMITFGIGVLRFGMIGLGAASLALLVLAQLLHAATFAAHHATVMQTMQPWFSGPLQARGQALFVSIAYGVGGSCGGLLMSACWDGLGPRAVYGLAAVLCAAAAGAAALSFSWQRRLA